jgi:hypothetical protein
MVTGLWQVNRSKTEISVFHQNYNIVTSIEVDGEVAGSESSINVLGVEFDSRFLWTVQVPTSIKKAYKSLHTIKLINKFCNKKQLNVLLTFNF